MTETFEKIISYLGFIPIGWACFNLLNFFYSNDNSNNERLLKSLSEKRIINNTQKFLLENINFLNTQNIKIDINGFILFHQSVLNRTVYDLIAITLGIFWITFWLGIDDYNYNPRTFLVLLALLIPSYVLLRFSSRKIIIDLKSKEISNEKSFYSSYGHFKGKLKLSNIDITIDSAGLKFGKKEAYEKIEIHQKLNESEQKLWVQLFNELTAANTV